jgi:hypothetical protein
VINKEAERMFKCSEKVKKDCYRTIQEKRISRRADLIERLKENMKRDPEGIWSELLEELLANPIKLV